MKLIRHRINTVQDLKTVSHEMGVELDLREGCDGQNSGKIILQHDPFKEGESFEDYLKQYRHGLMILNIKTEGIESAVLELVKKYKVKDYFFLDVAFPAMMKLVLKGEKQIAVRFSEHEPVEQCLALRGLVDWVWADCFTRLPFTPESYTALKGSFKICLVSPELQNHPKERILEFKNELKRYPIDAVCTKYPELWQS